MAVGGISCPVCADPAACDHDLDERWALCRVMQVPEEPEVASFDSGDAGQFGRRESWARRRADGDLLRRLMASREGRRFMRARLKRCGLFDTSVNPAAPNELTMAFAAGQHDIGLTYVRDFYRLCADDYFTMVKGYWNETP